MVKNFKKNKRGSVLYKTKDFRSGFVLLFAVTISAIVLAISLGVANIALKEVKFGTNARDANDAFFAADTGIEYALWIDKPIHNEFNTFVPKVTLKVWSGLGSSGQGCAQVIVDKRTSPAATIIISKGYNIGNGDDAPLHDSCNPPLNAVEREIKINY